MFGLRRSHPLLYFLAGLIVGGLIVYNIYFIIYSSEHLPSNKLSMNALKMVKNKVHEIQLREGFHHEDHQQNDSLNQMEGQQLLIFDHEHEEGQLAVQIKKKIRVFCWIMTTRKNTFSKAIHINSTWAQRCNKHVFITALEDSNLPNVNLGIDEGRNLLWGKTKRAFEYIYRNEIENFDWFLKADDDTYVIMENLRFMLMAHSPTDPVYFGCKFKPFVKQGYMSGGSGYVLSKEAVRRLAIEGIPDPSKCKKADSGAEDAEMGKCLAKIGVAAGDSRDSEGRHRMLPFSPLSHFENNASLPKWFDKYMYYPYKQGSECCSDHMISFHYVTRAQLYAIHNLIYHIQLFGLSSTNNDGISTDPEVLFESAKSLARMESILSNDAKKFSINK